jgi:hypothetical protein
MQTATAVDSRPLAAKIGVGEIFAVQSSSNPETAHMVAKLYNKDGSDTYTCSCPATGPCRHISQVRSGRHV